MVYSECARGPGGLRVGSPPVGSAEAKGSGPGVTTKPATSKGTSGTASR